MRQFGNEIQSRKRISGVLFFGTFLAHFAWTAYVSNKDGFAFVVAFQEFISSIYYSVPGFEWKGFGAYVVSAALASSCVINIFRRLLEGVFLGWLGFKTYDRSSLLRSSLLLISYGAMIYFAIGFFGEKYSSRPLDAINIFLIAISTYIAGFLVDLMDDVISGFYCIYIGGRA